MFRKFLLVAFVVLAILETAQAQSVTLTIDAGYLRNATGTTDEPVGGLLQLIASPSGTFSAPSVSSFIGGDNALVASFAMNYTGGPGEVIKTLASLALTTANYTLTSGETLLLRFYPSLTYSGTQNYYTTGPTALTTFGQVRSNTTEFSATDASETAWIVPAAGAAKNITYITLLDGGTYADGPNGIGVTSFATNAVSPIPEPSMYALFAAGFVGMIGSRVWNRRRKELPLIG